MTAEGKFEEGKGRAKEAAGKATGDERLEAEGAADRAAGATKSKFGEIVDKLKAPFRR